MLVAFEKLDSKTLRGQIAERIRHAILQGALKPGERIVERQLAAQVGASLTAVREVLIELADNEFLVTSLRRVIVPLFPYTPICFRRLSVFDLLGDASPHIPVLEAIKARDAEAAGTAALRGMDEWLDSIRSYVSKEPDLDNNNEDHQS